VAVGTWSESDAKSSPVVTEVGVETEIGVETDVSQRPPGGTENHVEFLGTDR